MKKLSYIILGFLIGAFATYYLCPRDLDTDGETKIVKPKGVITPEVAKSLNNNWTKYREAAVDSAARSQGRAKDDRSTWWSLEDVENYLEYAKNQSDSLGYNMTGVRVYLGVYGKNAGQSKKDLTTMFVVPTGKKSQAEASSLSLNLLLPPRDEDLPIDPLNDGTGGGSGYPQ